MYLLALALEARGRSRDLDELTFQLASKVTPWNTAVPGKMTSALGAYARLSNTPPT
jgi:hypothetical protein